MLWALALQGYDYSVKDIPGKDNVVVDYLSRLVFESEIALFYCVLLYILLGIC